MISHRTTLCGRDSMNTIALVLIVVGTLLAVLGLVQVADRRRATGIAVALFGLIVAAVPFVSSCLVAD